jgi:hypothetical protein
MAAVIDFKSGLSVAEKAASPSARCEVRFSSARYLRPIPDGYRRLRGIDNYRSRNSSRSTPRNDDDSLGKEGPHPRFVVRRFKKVGNLTKIFVDPPLRRSRSA